jgi:hypothetical protein
MDLDPELSRHGIGATSVGGVLISRETAPGPVVHYAESYI